MVMKYLFLELLQILLTQSGVIPRITSGKDFVRINLLSSLRQSRQSFLGDTDTPVIKYDPQNKEGALIAQKIESLFQNGLQTSSDETSSYDFDVSQKEANQEELSFVEDGSSTQFQLNLNLNVDLQPGKPSKLRVPQGELTLMFIPRIRGPNGASAVELSQSSLKKLLTESDQPTNMVMVNGGVLLMSLKPDEDKMTKPRNTVTSLPTSQTTQFTYPKEWKDKMPLFPQTSDVKDVKEEQDDLPVFPYKPYFSKDDKIVSSTTKNPPFISTSTTTITTETSTSTTTSLTTGTTETSSKASVQTYNNHLSPLFQNEVDIHHPTLKDEYASKDETINKGSATFIPFNSDSMKSRKNITDIYERLKNYYLNINNRNSIETKKEKPEKRFRLNDDPGSSSFDNVNVVIPGRFNPQYSPNSVTQCKKDSSTNGTRVCTNVVPNNCQGAFKIGGNCNSQARLDNTKLPPSEFVMGEEQAGNSDKRFVPFTPQQTNMNMQSNTRLPLPLPLNLRFQQDNHERSTTRRPTTSTTPSTTRRSFTTTATTTMTPHDALVDRVMSMEPPELRDALMDPMMMAIGTMLAMSGAYMAISIQEVAAANALAFSLGAAGKRKKK